MQTVAECYKKVRKDCFKFIRSQEIKKDKFINKAKMVKYFLIPICFWIAKKAKNRKPWQARDHRFSSFSDDNPYW